MKIVDWKNSVNELELKDIGNCLENGGLVIFPTETVYGIGALATNRNAVDNIFIAKGRANDNPLIVHLSNKEEINKYAYISNDVEKKLIDSFMPGPFTIILKKKEIIPNNVSAGLDTVGIRIPSNYIANKILSYNNLPIAAPSANISGRPSGTNINDIINEFKDKVDYIIDGNNTDIGVESTVVKVINNIPVILRPGFISKEDIIDTIGVVKVDNNIFKKSIGKVESPGKLINYFSENSNKETVIIGSSLLNSIPCKEFLCYGDSLEEISHNIFSLLRKADIYEPKIILIEGVSSDNLGLAIMNRLIRACNYNYIGDKF